MISVNNQKIPFTNGMTMEDAIKEALKDPLIRSKLEKNEGLCFLNKKFIEKHNYKKTVLHDGDSIKIMRSVQGG